MALEDDVKALTTVLAALAAKLPGGATTTTLTATRGPGRPRKVTFDEVKVVAKKLSDERGGPVARNLIATHAGKENGKLVDMDESKYANFIADVDLLLAQQPAEPAETDL